MLIYWKCCECSNGVLKHRSFHFSFHPFDHQEFMLSSIYAKASCDASLKHENAYKNKFSLIFCLQQQNRFNLLKLISLDVRVRSITFTFERPSYLDLLPLVVLTAVPTHGNDILLQKQLAS